MKCSRYIETIEKTGNAKPQRQTLIRNHVQKCPQVIILMKAIKT